MSDDAIRVSMAKPASAGPRRLGPAVGAPVSGSGPEIELSRELAERYRVLGELGRGQMGVVYRAVQSALKREVAIKFPTLTSEISAERFLREARLLAGLSHPNLVRVLDADLDGGRPFLVLEFVIGYSLMEYRERQENLGVPEAVGLVCQVLDGLGAAHAAGIVHRDIKSGNVLVASDGVAKLADFGLARAAESSTVTEAGTLLGTPAYLAPEVAQGQPATAAADLYALGVMLFELITGRLPFTALSPGELLTKHMRDTPPKLAKFASDIPDELEAAYQALMAKQPAARPDAPTAGRLLRKAMGLNESATALHIPTLPPAAPPEPAITPGKTPRRTTGRSRANATPVSAPDPSGSLDEAPESTWAWAMGGFAMALLLAAPLAFWITRPPAPRPVDRVSVASAAPSSPPAPSASPAAEVLEPFPGAAARKSRWTPLRKKTTEPSGLVIWESEIDGAPMVHVPGGPATRGNSECGPDENPVRTVQVDEFWIDRFEVTNRLYDKFVAATGHAPRERHTKRYAAFDAPDNPVVSVTWQDAVDYGLWAGKRLPTEAEWEKAARGPKANRYPWGSEEPGVKPFANIADPMGIAPDGYELTAPVGSFPLGMSYYGAHDMSGNVWEWCSDWYGDNYYATGPDQNPTGPPHGRWKASRGGSHVSYMNNDLLSSYRKKGEPTARHLDQGFRCVRPGPL